MLVDAAKHGDVEIPSSATSPSWPAGRRLPHVPGRDRGHPQAADRVLHAGADGMVVNTTSDRVKHAQNAVVEFLLVNHPLDCPVCDKGGECPLQDISYGWGAGRSRFIEPKRHFKKPLELSPLVAIDRERCILCYRCVRFSQEVAEDYQLVFLERGDHTFVGTHDGHPYVAPFSGNIIELCPVGALTSRAYRFRARPWDIEGSGTRLHALPLAVQRQADVRDDAKVVRVLARDNEEVDDGWLCDKGRFGYQAFSSRRAHHRAARARRRLPARGVLGARAVGRRRGAEALRRRHRRARRRRGHERGGLPPPAPAARGARLAARRRRAARSPAARTRALARPELAARGLGHRPRRRDARARHGARRRGADPRPARAQGGAPQRRAAGRRLEPPVDARPERRGDAALRARRAEAALGALAAALGSPRAGALDELAAARGLARIHPGRPSERRRAAAATRRRERCAPCADAAARRRRRRGHLGRARLRRRARRQALEALLGARRRARDRGARTSPG